MLWVSFLIVAAATVVPHEDLAQKFQDDLKKELSKMKQDAQAFRPSGLLQTSAGEHPEDTAAVKEIEHQKRRTKALEDEENTDELEEEAEDKRYNEEMKSSGKGKDDDSDDSESDADEESFLQTSDKSPTADLEEMTKQFKAHIEARADDAKRSLVAPDRQESAVSLMETHERARRSSAHESLRSFQQAMANRGNWLTQFAAANGIHIPDQPKKVASSLPSMPSSFVESNVRPSSLLQADASSATGTETGMLLSTEAQSEMSSQGKLNLERFDNAMDLMAHKFRDNAQTLEHEAMPSEPLPHSSFIQVGQRGDVELDDLDKVEQRLKSLGDRLKSETVKYKEEEAETLAHPMSLHPMSLLERKPHSMTELRQVHDDLSKDLEADRDEFKSELAKDVKDAEPPSTLNQDLEELGNDETPAKPSSLLEEAKPDDAFADLNKVQDHLKALQDRLKAETNKFTEEAKSVTFVEETSKESAQPSSLMEMGGPQTHHHSHKRKEQFKKAHDQLASLEDHLKDTAHKYEEANEFERSEGTFSHPASSLAEMRSNYDEGKWAAKQADMESTVKEQEENLNEMAHKFRDNAKAEEAFVNEFKKNKVAEDGAEKADGTTAALTASTTDASTDAEDSDSTDGSDASAESLLETPVDDIAAAVRASDDEDTAALKARTAALTSPYTSRLGLAALASEKRNEEAADSMFPGNMRKDF